MAKNDKLYKLAKKPASKREKIMIRAAIAVGIVIVLIMVLSIPIIPMERHRGNQTYTEHVSVIRCIKEWIRSKKVTPDAPELSKDTNSYALISGAESIDDNRNFTNDQIIEGQFTVLVLGFDESRELSDVMMLFLFDIHDHKLNVLQIPRDSFVPDYTSNETGKINSVYMCGDQSLIPIQRTVNAVRETFGIPIDRYITTGCDDIVDIVDILGGIPINLPEDVFYSYDKILYAGEQVLDGEQAELMVRARKGYDEGDIGRVKAQRIFLAACMEKAKDMGSVELASYMKEIYEKKLVATDMTLGELSILGDFGTLLDMEDVTVQLVPGEGSEFNGYSVWSIHKKATIDVLNKYFRPYQVDLRSDELPITELVDESNYLTDAYDQNQDTLQEIKNGAKPGTNKKKTSDVTYSSSSSSSSESDNVYVFGGDDYQNNNYSGGDQGYDDGGYSGGWGDGGYSGGDGGGDNGSYSDGGGDNGSYSGGGDNGGYSGGDGGDTGGNGGDAGAEAPVDAGAEVNNEGGGEE